MGYGTAVAETLTQCEFGALAYELDDNGEGFPPIPDSEWRQPETPGFHDRTLYLKMPGFIVVKGWASRRFLNRVTFWTYDPRFARISQFLPGVEPVVLPACVEPIGWCYADEVGA